jgi:integrase
MALNDAKVKAAKPKAAAYKLSDAGQLFLHVTPAGGKHWRMNYTFGRNANGKPAQKTLTIGPYPVVSLGEAREARDAAKRILLDGRDPAVVKQLTRQDRSAAADNTFQVVGERWFQLKSGWSLAKLDAWRAEHGSARVRDAANWSDPKVRGWSAVHPDDVLKALRRDAFPALGALPMADIDTPKILDLLHSIEKRGAIESAHRLRQRISDIFTYAMAAKICHADPAPASLTKVLQTAPRARKQPSIVDGTQDNAERLRRVRKLLADVEAERTRAGTKFAMRLLALTAVRPGEIAGAEWTEFEDLDGPAPLWRIPAARMKGDLDRKAEVGGDHLVPLSRQAVEVLAALRPLSGRYALLFPGERFSHRPMSENTLNALLKRAGYTSRHVPHGFRAAFSTIMNERDESEDNDRAVIELMLAHVPGNKVEAAYNRAAYMGRRRDLAQAYADLIIVGLEPPEAQLGRPIRFAATGPRAARDEA